MFLGHSVHSLSVQTMHIIDNVSNTVTVQAACALRQFRFKSEHRMTYTSRRGCLSSIVECNIILKCALENWQEVFTKNLDKIRLKKQQKSEQKLQQFTKLQYVRAIWVKTRKEQKWFWGDVIACWIPDWLLLD